MGKSRLCAELFAYIEDRPGLVTLASGPLPSLRGRHRLLGAGRDRQGRVRHPRVRLARAGRGQARARAARRRSRPALAQGPAAPLVGAPASPRPQEESFTAWRRFLRVAGGARDRPCSCSRTCTGPTTPCSPSSSTWPTGRTACRCCCSAPPARSSTSSTRPGRPGSATRTTINLAPLTDEETARLISALLERAVLPAETQRALLERAGGNPLYAEEFVRLLADRGAAGRGTSEVPDSVQALIAARLDTLPPERKSLLQDAAVVGKVFWAGALAEMGGRDPREVEQALHELSRKELVRPARTSSMQGESRVRLLAPAGQGRLLRADPARRPRRPPPRGRAWIERQAGERAEDLADVLAHHYLTALELTRAAGEAEEAQELESKRDPLPRSGRRARAPARRRPRGAEPGQGARARPGRPPRARVAARALGAGGAPAGPAAGGTRGARGSARASPGQGKTLAAGARVTARDRPAGASATRRARRRSRRRSRARGASHPARARCRLRASSRGVPRRRRFPGGIAAADRALALAAELGLPEPARALGFRGCARGSSASGRDSTTCARALELAIEQGAGREAAVLHNNLAIATGSTKGRRRRSRLAEEGIDSASGAGSPNPRSGSAHGPAFLAELGRPEQALAKPSRWRSSRGGGRIHVSSRARVQLRLLAERGAPSGLRATSSLRPPARAASRRTARWRSRPPPAAARAGSPAGGAALLDELEQREGSGPTPLRRIAARGRAHRPRLGELELAARLADGVEPRTPLFEHALCACRADSPRPRETTPRPPLSMPRRPTLARFGNVPERAYALLGQGRCLLRSAARRARCRSRSARAVRVDGLPPGARRDRGAARASGRRCSVAGASPNFSAIGSGHALSSG